MSEERRTVERTDLDTQMPADGFGIPDVDADTARGALGSEPTDRGASDQTIPGVGPEDLGTPEAGAEAAGE